MPTETTFAAIAGVCDIFVDLVGSAWYRSQLPPDRYIAHPMPRGGTGPRRAMLELAKKLAALVRAGRRLYIHCHGGFGRTTVAACVLLNELDGTRGDEAIAHVEALKEQRADKSRNFIPCPETNRQARFICALCGGSPPDRSDRSWLARKS